MFYRTYFSIYHDPYWGRMVGLFGWVRKDRWGRYIREDVFGVSAPLDDILEEFGGVDIWLETYQDMERMYPEKLCEYDVLNTYFEAGGAKRTPGKQIDPARIGQETPDGRYWCNTDIVSVNHLKDNLRKRNRKKAVQISGDGLKFDPEQCRRRVALFNKPGAKATKTRSASSPAGRCA